ncbi:MAG: class I SAM-dependent DNA methyltransferase [Thermoanaerobaculia bacterium]|nr:class I SAM-dependent DNA methyltransferase [Thermoanaerobaculia bacterium]
MQKAYVQGYQYAQAFDAPPPFLIVCDIGYCFDLYATFDGSWNYRHFPDAKRHRIFLSDLPTHAATLRAIFTDPHRLDPSRNAAKVTREIAAHLAELARGLEAAGHSGERIATFLMRCIFTMFAEDVGLLPEGLFVKALESDWIKDPKRFVPDVTALWTTMNTGGSIFRVGKILQFNGGLFREPEALPLSRKQLEQLLEAARTDWVDVEPAIFGTLLERALDPKERHALGAPFTPRAYVERLVRATIEEPLRADWDVVRTEVYHLAESGKEPAAQGAVRAFHKKLCEVRVLDPACGTGNFLYVTLDLMKRLESEVLGLLADLGEMQAPLELQGLTVTPAQFHGIEIKPWAKEIAELVLWIGYLQWQLRSKGDSGVIQEPVLQEYGNIECRDAVLDYDRVEPLLDGNGQPVARWDGETTKSSPVTGEQIPDESARTTVLRYVNPRRAEWPEADYVVTNPPYMGEKRQRDVFGDGYVDALRAVYSDLSDSVDYVAYWWHRCATAIEVRTMLRAGLITTTAMLQSKNRALMEAWAKKQIRVAWAIPDHVWCDARTNAEVRVAMMVLARNPPNARLVTVQYTRYIQGDVPVIGEVTTTALNVDLTAHTDVPSATQRPLLAWRGLSSQGVKRGGEGFLCNPEEARQLIATTPRAHEVLRTYRNGQDFAGRSRGLYAIDFGLMSEDEARSFPALYGRILDRVRPERALNKRASYARYWWRFLEPRRELRSALMGLARYIVTLEVGKHRVFSFLDVETLADGTLVCIASDDSFVLGALSSRVHAVWSLAAGGWLEDKHRYNKTLCLDPFPLPAAQNSEVDRVRGLGEALDVHRNRQQAQHPNLTITGMYNVLEKLRSGEALTAKEKTIHEQGLVSVLKQLHDDLDAAVFDAYGWTPTLTDEEILERLVALNAERVEEEKRGLVRWLRPEFQNPGGRKAATQDSLAGTGTEAEDEELASMSAVARSWPKALPERIAAVRDLLHQRQPQSFESIRGEFTGAKPKELQGILESLAALGLAVVREEGGARVWAAGGRPTGSGSPG